MASIERIRIELSGAAVIGPSVMTLYASEGAGGSIASLAQAWLDNMDNLFPNTLTFTFPTEGDVLDSETGTVTGAWTGGSLPFVMGTATDNTFSHGVGARVVWNTGAFANGRRVRGSTFLVPLSGGLWDTSGEIAPANVNDIQTKTTAFVTATAGELIVWSRPTPQRVGGTASVTSATFTGRTSWLTSRRT